MTETYIWCYIVCFVSELDCVRIPNALRLTTGRLDLNLSYSHWLCTGDISVKALQDKYSLSHTVVPLLKDTPERTPPP